MKKAETLGAVAALQTTAVPVVDRPDTAGPLLEGPEVDRLRGLTPPSIAHGRRAGSAAGTRRARPASGKGT
jgi:hypothetical protein